MRPVERYSYNRLLSIFPLRFTTYRQILIVWHLQSNTNSSVVPPNSQIGCWRQKLAWTMCSVPNALKTSSQSSDYRQCFIANSLGVATLLWCRSYGNQCLLPLLGFSPVGSTLAPCARGPGFDSMSCCSHFVILNHTTIKIKINRSSRRWCHLLTSILVANTRASYCPLKRDRCYCHNKVNTTMLTLIGRMWTCVWSEIDQVLLLWVWSRLVTWMACWAVRWRYWWSYIGLQMSNN
jgi:hypothetical protein